MKQDSTGPHKHQDKQLLTTLDPDDVHVVWGNPQNLHAVHQAHKEDMQLRKMRCNTSPPVTTRMNQIKVKATDQPHHSTKIPIITIITRRCCSCTRSSIIHHWKNKKLKKDKPKCDVLTINVLWWCHCKVTVKLEIDNERKFSKHGLECLESPWNQNGMVKWCSLYQANFLHPNKPNNYYYFPLMIY